MFGSQQQNTFEIENSSDKKVIGDNKPHNMFFLITWWWRIFLPNYLGTREIESNHNNYLDMIIQWQVESEHWGINFWLGSD